MILDSRNLGERDGFDLVAEILPDDLTPAFYGVSADYMTEGGYSPEQEAEFDAGDWSFVILRVRAMREGVTLGEASVGGCEYGYSCEWEGFIDPLKDDDYLHDLRGEAVTDALDTLARIVGRVVA